MALSHQQKKYIKEHIRTSPLDEIAAETNLTEKEILAYLKDQWREDKYERFVSQLHGKQDANIADNSLLHAPVIIRFSQWIKDPFNLGALAFIALLVIVAYFNSLNNVFLSDDLSGIVQNKEIGSFKFVLSQPFNIVRGMFYYIAYKMGGLNPAYFRSINILMHLGSTYMLFYFFSQITKRNLALFAAALFAVHPLLTESVTWVSGGGYSEYTFFFLLALNLYINSRERILSLVLSNIFYYCALVSSAAAVPLVIIFPLYEYLFGSLKKNYLRTVPYFFVMLLPFLNNLFAIGQRLQIQRAVYYQDKGVDNPLLQIPTAISSYIYLTLWPYKLTLYHSELNFTIWDFSIRAIITLLFFASFIYFYKKSKIIFFMLCIFITSLLTTLTPLRISWIVAERYVYLGTGMLIFIITYFIYRFFERTKFLVFGYVLFTLLIIVLTGRTIMRNIDWKNEDNLWVATGLTSPSSPNTHNNLGDVYTRHGDYEKAAKEFSTAIAIKPNYADAYHNLANTYTRMGKTQEALDTYKKSIELNPNLWQSYQNIAAIYFGKADFKTSISYMQKAL